MLVQPLRHAPLKVPSFRPTVEPKVAVLLNANARKVTDRVIRSLSHVVPEEDLFVSRSQLDARRITQTVLERRYHTVFCGGGDGTFMGFVNEIYGQLDQRNRYLHQRAPRFGILKLGTGNGMAALVNASSTRSDGILDDVLRARAGEVPGYRRVDMLQVEGKRAPFAGLGVDGKLLNDYIWVKENLGRGLLKRAMTGPGGYFSAVAFKTIPHYLTASTWFDAEVINNEGEAFLIGPDGEPTGTSYKPGETMFKGRLMMASAGTIPYYGFELKMFPFATKRAGYMNLRLGAVGTMNAIANLPKLWAGTWRDEGIRDFYAKDVSIKFTKPMAFQIGGDAEGYREQVRLQVASEPIELVDFTGAVN
ncbi:MAG: diacylglycerol/lipid kinase family protein [Myxococcaceae bacterium]